jgi:tetratricopeptide (TPR) repeat protein
MRYLAIGDAEATRAAAEGRSQQALLALALIRRATGKNEEAAQFLREILDQDPGSVEAWRVLGGTLESAGRTREAEEAYQSAIRLRPSYWPAHNSLAVFYKARGQYARAEEEWKLAIQLAPEHPLLYRNLGGLYHLQGRYDEALRTLRRSIELRPTAEAYSNVGTVLFFQDKYKEAVAEFEKAVELGPKNAVNWGNLGDACWALPEKRQRAMEAYGRAAELAEQQLGVNPKNARVRKSLAVYQVKVGRADEARTNIKVALSDEPENVDVLFAAVRVFELAGDRDRALSFLKDCLGRGYALREVQIEPDLASLRRDPRYQSILPRGR